MIENLTQSDYITIVIFILTTILSSLLYQRVKQTKFIFLEKTHQDLNTADFEKIESLKLIYQEEEINNYLIYLRGTIIMVGDHDVNPSNIYRPISFKLNDINGKWKSTKLLKSTEFLETDFEIIDNEVQIKTGLIKKNDFVSFEGFYNAKRNGYYIIHRILNVKGKVHKIYEDFLFIYILGALISLLFIYLSSLDLFPRNREIDVEKDSPKTITTKKFDLSKEDSLMLNTYKYDELYIVNEDTLKFDSIFQENHILNKKLNERRIKIYDSLIDNHFKNKPNNSDNKLSKLKLILNKPNDTLFYEDYYSITLKKDSLLRKLLKQNQIKENKTYKLNDTISVSFTLPNVYKRLEEPETFGGFLRQLFPYLSIMFFLIIFLYSVYNIYYLKTLSKIYK